MMYSPEFFMDAPGKKSTRKVFWDAIKLVELICLEFVKKFYISHLYFSFLPLLHGHTVSYGEMSNKGELGFGVVSKTQFFCRVMLTFHTCERVSQ